MKYKKGDILYHRKHLSAKIEVLGYKGNRYELRFFGNSKEMVRYILINVVDKHPDWTLQSKLSKILT